MNSTKVTAAAALTTFVVTAVFTKSVTIQACSMDKALEVAEATGLCESVDTNLLNWTAHEVVSGRTKT